MTESDELPAYEYGDGFGTVDIREGGGQYRILFETADAVRAAWMKGDAFIDIVTTHGARHTVKGAMIASVGTMTAAQWARYQQLIADEKADDRRRGVD